MIKLVILILILYINYITCTTMIPLSKDHCTNVILRAGAPSRAKIPQQDMCSLAQLIVRNRYMWNWQSHMNSLCTGAPSYLITWCEYLACSLSECNDFQSGTCVVLKGPAGLGDSKALKPGESNDNQVELTPCPSKYLVYSCLPKIFTQQFAGCLDNLYDRI